MASAFIIIKLCNDDGYVEEEVIQEVSGDRWDVSRDLETLNNKIKSLLDIDQDEV